MIARLMCITWHKRRHKNKNKILLLHKYLMFLLITTQIIEIYNCNILENYSNIYSLHINFVLISLILYTILGFIMIFNQNLSNDKLLTNLLNSLYWKIFFIIWDLFGICFIRIEKHRKNSL
ncbi:MAG: hypothetical protein ACKESC_01415 [Candidatus Hodgkinia cicadicola]